MFVALETGSAVFGTDVYVSIDRGLTWVNLSAAGGIRALSDPTGPDPDIIQRFKFLSRRFWAPHENGGIFVSIAA